MRTLLLLITIGVAYAADAALRIWKMDPTHSSFMGDTKPKSLLVRIEPHVKGEVLTLDRIEADGRSTSSSTILILTAHRTIFRISDVPELNLPGDLMAATWKYCGIAKAVRRSGSSGGS